MFDCDADPAAIRMGLAEDPRLARLVAARPGLRVPGAWDGFELAARAILGQQVSVAAATRLAGRLVAAFGAPLTDPTDPPGPSHVLPSSHVLPLSHVFPTPERLAAAVAEAPGLLAPGQPPEAVVAALRVRPISHDARPSLRTRIMMAAA
jgi:3-methyladenine DNA glycosylase/8-oxoguanine DNA glycosylase